MDLFVYPDSAPSLTKGELSNLAPQSTSSFVAGPFPSLVPGGTGLDEIEGALHPAIPLDFRGEIRRGSLPRSLDPPYSLV